MASGSMQGFFRQRKTSGASRIINSKSKATEKSISSAANLKSPKSSPSDFGTLDFPDVLQNNAVLQIPSSLNTMAVQDENDERELRGFDMNMAYGPCLGLSRMARWERAHRLGLDPPLGIHSLLEKPVVRPQCLWDGRV